MKASRIALAGGLALSVMALMGAGRPTPNVIARGGTLTVALPPQTNLTWYIPQMNAANDSVYNGWIEDQLFQPMIYLNDSYQIVTQNSIAQHITSNKQGTIYHVFLNKKWHWSNGSPVTSHDVLFTYNFIKAASAPNAPSPWPFVGAGTGDLPQGIKSVAANGPYEVTFTLKHPANKQWFEYNGLLQLTPLPAQQFDKYGTNWTKEAAYMGSIATNPKTGMGLVDGPFRLTKATPNQEWIMRPNERYDGHKASVARLVFAYEASNAAEFAALRTGTVNLGYLDPSQLGAKGALTSQGDKIFPGYSLGVFWTEMNMWPASAQRSVFGQLYVRKALMMSIDQKAYIHSILHGYGSPQYGPIPQTPRTKFYDPKAEPVIPYNLAKAKKLLTSHGWREVNGVMTKGKQKMNWTMIYVTGSQAGLEQVQLMKADWAKIGVRVNLKGETFGSFLGITANKKNGSWQLAEGSGWIYNGPGWMPTGGQLFSSTAPSGTGYSNRHEDYLINQTHRPYATEAQFMRAFNAYEAYTASQLPMLWNANPATINVAGPTLIGGRRFSNPVTGNPSFNMMRVK